MAGRTRPQSMKDRIWTFHDDRCARNLPASHADFLAKSHLTKAAYPPATYNASVQKWEQKIPTFLDKGERAKRTEWFSGRRREKPTIGSKVQEYGDTCAKTVQRPSYARFLEQAGYTEMQCSRATYDRGIRRNPL